MCVNKSLIGKTSVVAILELHVLWTNRHESPEVCERAIFNHLQEVLTHMF